MINTSLVLENSRLGQHISHSPDIVTSELGITVTSVGFPSNLQEIHPCANQGNFLELSIGEVSIINEMDQQLTSSGKGVKWKTKVRDKQAIELDACT